MTQQFTGPCPVCGGRAFSHTDVLWPALVDTWQLAPQESAYVNRQQGFSCQGCHNNLRAMGLAAAILRQYHCAGTLAEFCQRCDALQVLEINAAGNLSPFLAALPGHRLVEYPRFDMTQLELASDSYDLVVHSDTLEHVPLPVRGLAECRRVLRRDGLCIFTVPIIGARMTRSRAGLAPSYHGRSGVLADDQLVHTEFGADVWDQVLQAGFSSCEIFCFEYPAALVIIAKK